MKPWLAILALALCLAASSLDPCLEAPEAIACAGLDLDMPLPSRCFARTIIVSGTVILCWTCCFPGVGCTETCTEGGWILAPEEVPL